ncbi:MAG: hypothetical protein AAB861_02225 [Patescibacteria group bacterium]
MAIDWKKILAVVGGLVILAGVAYLVLWLKPGVKPPGAGAGIQNGTSTATTDISGWKTYRNEKYGFEFKYSSDWPSEDYSSSSSLDIYFHPPINQGSDSESFYGFRILVTKFRFNNLTDWFIAKNHDNPYAYLSTSSFSFGGYAAYKYDAHPEVDSGPCGARFVIVRGEYIYNLSYCLVDSDDKVFTEIGKMFKFIEPATSTVDTSGWKTYRNEAEGFTFDYPSNWFVQYEKGGWIVVVSVKKFETGDEPWFNASCKKDANSESLSLSELFNERWGSVMKMYSPEKETIKVGGYDAIRFVDTEAIPLNANVFLVKDKAVCSFMLDDGSDVSEKILSTFKFIEPATEKVVVDYTKPRGARIGYIKKVYENSGGIYIDFDEVKFFYGEAAIKFLKENGGCTPDEGGGCFLPNNYTISNKDEVVQSLLVKEGAKVTVLGNGWDLVEPNGVSITAQEFKSNFGQSINEVKPGAKFYVPSYPPYWINQDESGRVTSIVEQYIP